MISDEFKEELLSELYDGKSGKIRLETLRKYKRLGMSKETMYTVLNSLREEMREKGDEKTEDIIMEAMDLVVGYCNPKIKLFP